MEVDNEDPNSEDWEDDEMEESESWWKVEPMSNPSKDWLPPGSPPAVTHGCTCPVLDNHHGDGVSMRGERLWWKSNDCPLHGGFTPKEPDEHR